MKAKALLRTSVFANLLPVSSHKTLLNDKRVSDMIMGFHAYSPAALFISKNEG
jgi:hypothetical protein